MEALANAVATPPLTALYAAGDPNHDLKQAETASMEVIEAIYAALMRGDLESTAELLLPHATFTLIGVPGMEGHWQGPTEILAATARNLALVVPHEVVFEHVIAQGDQVAIRFRERGLHLERNTSYSASAIHWFHFEGNRVAAIFGLAHMTLPEAG
jgi:ketosteroid isomerase-like protein